MAASDGNDGTNVPLLVEGVGRTGRNRTDPGARLHVTIRRLKCRLIKLSTLLRMNTNDDEFKNR